MNLKTLEIENQNLLKILNSMIDLVYKLCKKFKEKTLHILKQQEIIVSKSELYNKLFFSHNELTSKMKDDQFKKIEMMEKEFEVRLKEITKIKEEEFKANCIMRIKFDELMMFAEKAASQKKKAQKSIKTLQKQLDSLQDKMALKEKELKPSESKKETFTPISQEKTETLSYFKPLYLPCNLSYPAHLKKDQNQSAMNFPSSSHSKQTNDKNQSNLFINGVANDRGNARNTYEPIKNSIISSTDKTKNDDIITSSQFSKKADRLATDSHYICPKCHEDYNNNLSFLQHCLICDS